MSFTEPPQVPDEFFLDFEDISWKSGKRESEDKKPIHLLATCNIFGVLHHVDFIRVIDKKIREGTPNEVTYQFSIEYIEAGVTYKSLCDMNPREEFQTVKVPGYEGDWVCIITPFQR